MLRPAFCWLTTVEATSILKRWRLRGKVVVSRVDGGWSVEGKDIMGL